MKKELIVIMFLIFNLGFSQRKIDTVPFLKKRFVNNLATYKNKRLKLVINALPYDIKGYKLAPLQRYPNAIKYGIKSILFYISTKPDETSLLFTKLGDFKFTGKQPVILKVYLVDNPNLDYLNGNFVGLLESNNWSSRVEKIMSSQDYIVDDIEVIGETILPNPSTTKSN